MALPASGYLSNTNRTNAEMQTALEDQRDVVYTSQIESVTDLRAFEGTADNQQASVLLGSDTYARVYWDAASTATDDGVNVFKVTSVTTGRWIRMDGSTVISTISATGTLPIPPKNGTHYVTYDAATGTLTLPTLSSTPVGGMIVVAKDNATQGAVNINPDGTDSVQWGTAQLRLYADGNKWALRRGNDRWELVFGSETGESGGKWARYANGVMTYTGIVSTSASDGGGTNFSLTVGFAGSGFRVMSNFTPWSGSGGVVGVTEASVVDSSTIKIKVSSVDLTSIDVESEDARFFAIGEWY